MTDQFAADVVGAALGSALYVNGSGKLTVTSGGAARRAATLASDALDIPSGVPGTVVNGSTSLGVYIKFILNI